MLVPVTAIESRVPSRWSAAHAGLRVQGRCDTSTLWQLPIHSFAPARSPAAFAGLTVYLAAPARSVLLRHAVFRRAVLCRQKSKMPDELITGHLVLATSYSRTAYRRTTIGAAAFHFRVRNGNGWGHCARVTRAQHLLRKALGCDDIRRLSQSPLPTFRKNTIFQSAHASRKSKVFSDSLTSTYGQ